MKNAQGFVQVKVVEGIEVRQNVKGEFMLGAVINTHSENKKEVTGIAAGEFPCPCDVHASVQAIAGTAATALMKLEIPPQLILELLQDAVQDGVNEAVEQHIKEEHPEMYDLGQRVKKGDIGAMLEMLLSV